MRDEQTVEFHLPLTSTVVLKQKQEMLHVPLDFGNNLTIDALVDSRAYVSAFAPNDLDKKNRKQHLIFSKPMTLPNFKDR